jgi:hypothetical protein
VFLAQEHVRRSLALIAIAAAPFEVGADRAISSRLARRLRAWDALNIGERFRVLIMVRASRVSVPPGEMGVHSCALRAELGGKEMGQADGSQLLLAA